LRQLQRLKRDVVFAQGAAAAPAAVRRAAAEILDGRAAAKLGPSTGLRRRTGTYASSLAARAQKLHRLRDDLGRVALVALFVVPLTSAEAALDVDLTSLRKVLGAVLRRLS